MKTRILLIIFILSGLIQVSAQDFNFGVKVAPAVSWLSVDQKGVSSDGPLVRFNWGFTGAYNLTENFALVSGFNINSLGGKLKPDGTNASVKSKYTEIQLPVIFQMKSGDISGFKVYLQIGLAEGVFLSAKDGHGESIYSQTIPFNTAYIIASGIDYPIKGDISLIGQIKYNGGLTDINNNKSYTVKSRFIELGVGVMF